MERVLLSVTSEVNPAPVCEREALEQKLWKLLLICIKMLQAAIQVQTGLGLEWGVAPCTPEREPRVFHWCLNAGHSIVGEGENQKSCKFISVTKNKQILYQHTSNGIHKRGWDRFSSKTNAAAVTFWVTTSSRACSVYFTACHCPVISDVGILTASMGKGTGRIHLYLMHSN